MPQLRVDPDELEQIAALLRREGAQLTEGAPSLRQGMARLDWNTGHRPFLDSMVTEAATQAANLGELLAELGRFAAERAAAYRAADEAGSDASTAIAQAHPAIFHPVAHLAVPPAPTGTDRPTAEQTAYLQAVLGVQGESGYGPRTQAAVWAFQAQHGIPVDGAVQIGPKTWGLIEQEAVRIEAGSSGPAPAVPETITVPYLSQVNAPWSQVKIGSDTYQRVGCTLTSMAMLVGRHRPDLVPDASIMANLAAGSTNGNGDVVWDQANSYLGAQWGLSLNHLPLPADPTAARQAALLGAYQSLQSGEPVVLGVGEGNTQHWVVIRGYEGEGAPQSPDQFLIHDPYNPNRRHLSDLLNDSKYAGQPLQALFQVQEAHS
jgi:hypothetical protein